MKWIDGLCAFALSFGIVFCAACVANADVGFVSNPLWLSSSHVTEGVAVNVATAITTQGVERVDGTVSFFANEKEIGTADFLIPSNAGGVVVAVSWVPGAGTYSVSAKITRAVAGNAQDLNVTEEVKADEPLVVEAERDVVSTQGRGAAAAPAVAGAATTSVGGIIEQAKSIAGPVGAEVIETTESWREKGKEYFDGKVVETGNVQGFASTTNKDLVSNPKEGVMGIWEMVQAYFYKVASFIFSNVYAFYIFFILLILWLLRKIWRRYSLD
jgi:hypothetical protein